MKILITGDSIIKRVDKFIPQHMLGHEIYIHPHPGTTIQRLTKQIQSKGCFDVYVIHVGTNDNALHFTYYKQYLQSLCDVIYNINSNAIIMFSALLYHYDNHHNSIEERVNPAGLLSIINHKFDLLIKLFKIMWRVEYPAHVIQNDYVSCGVFICYFAFQIVKNLDLMYEFDVISFRKSIYSILGGNCLTNEKYKRSYDKDSCNICYQKHS